MAAVTPAGGRWYNTVWRWHFYAGLLCVPFVLWLAITGTIYLWKPQLEAWLERPYDRLTVGTASSPATVVAQALAAVPGARLAEYRLPDAPTHAVRVVVDRGGIQSRVFVDPYRARVLGVVEEEWRPLRVVSRLHGTLMVGRPGSWLVEIAACWAIVMLLTGLYLWWPRNRGRGQGLAGIAYPRWRRGKRVFWRDTHAVAGIWVSVAALFLIATGLPWASAWGDYLGAIRAVAGATDGPVDWTQAGKSPGVPAHGDHAGHGAMAMATAAMPARDLDRVAAAAARLDFAAPVLVTPSTAGIRDWTIVSESPNRSLRARATIDPVTAATTSRQSFAQRHWIDRWVGYGISIHEGAYWGLANQIAGTLATLLLMTLAVSGTILWWRRRRIGLLGAPLPLSRPRFGAGLVAAIVALGVAMPLFGSTLLAVLGIERLVLRRSPAAARWLGLRPA